MSSPGTINCQGCGRTNGAEARRCLWCGIPLITRANRDSFETTRVEVDYLDGIERLEDPMPVRLTITPSAVVVNELLPGTRSVTIEAGSLVDARVVDASTVTGGRRERASRRWWLLIGPLALFVPGKRLPDTKQHDYILTVRYRHNGEMRNAVFHRDDGPGLKIVEGIARIINSMVRERSEAPPHDDG